MKVENREQREEEEITKPFNAFFKFLHFCLYRLDDYLSDDSLQQKSYIILRMHISI